MAKIYNRLKTQTLHSLNGRVGMGRWGTLYVNLFTPFFRRAVFFIDYNIQKIFDISKFFAHFFCLGSEFFFGGVMYVLTPLLLQAIDILDSNVNRRTLSFHAVRGVPAQTMLCAKQLRYFTFNSTVLYVKRSEKKRTDETTGARSWHIKSSFRVK